MRVPCDAAALLCGRINQAPGPMEAGLPSHAPSRRRLDAKRMHFQSLVNCWCSFSGRLELCLWHAYHLPSALLPKGAGSGLGCGDSSALCCEWARGPGVCELREERVVKVARVAVGLE